MIDKIKIDKKVKLTCVHNLLYVFCDNKLQWTFTHWCDLIIFFQLCGVLVYFLLDHNIMVCSNAKYQKGSFDNWNKERIPQGLKPIVNQETMMTSLITACTIQEKHLILTSSYHICNFFYQPYTFPFSYLINQFQPNSTFIHYLTFSQRYLIICVFLFVSVWHLNAVDSHCEMLIPTDCLVSQVYTANVMSCLYQITISFICTLYSYTIYMYKCISSSLWLGLLYIQFIFIII